MVYKTIYKPYSLSKFITEARGEGGGINYEAEAKGWDAALNEEVNDGYKIIKCGTIVFGGDVIFWATLEKVEKA